MSRKVKEGHGLTFQMRKVMGGGGCVACRIILSAPVPVPFLRTLDFGFGTWIWDWRGGVKRGLTNVKLFFLKASLSRFNFH